MQINESYIIEIKKRLFKSLLLYLLIATPFIIYASKIYTIFSQSFTEILPQKSHLIATDITSPFMVPLKLALWLAFLSALPYFFIQIWGFIKPALYEQERRTLQFTFYSSIVLFYLGLSLAYLWVCPLSFKFFIYTLPEGVLMMTDIGHYMDFVFKLMLAFGFAFQAPVILIVLIYKRIINIDSLRTKRPYVIVGSFIIGMLLTPPDVISQVLLALPLWGLFELSLVISQFLISRAGTVTGPYKT